MNRSISYIATALLMASATTTACLAEAAGLNGGMDAWFDPGAIAAGPSAAPSRPIATLQTATPWTTALPGGPATLRGKVVVVNFWTYSCINSLRALPYLRAWNERYGDKGLVVIGVHAPEFAFEKEAPNVRAAAARLGVRYPNLQDNDYAVWQKFGNEGWPGFYFIDAKGRVRSQYLGEGGYAQSEQMIRKLLTEAGHDLSGVAASPVTGSGIEAEADWADLRTPESYLGFAKALNFASPGGISKNASHPYSLTDRLPLNHWDLSGQWTVGPEYAALDKADGAIRFRLHARDAHLVLGGAPDGRPVRFRVTIDGKAPGADHGVDVDAAGWGEVSADRLYQIVRQSGAVDDRTVTVTFSRPGIRAYAFTFG